LKALKGLFSFCGLLNQNLRAKVLVKGFLSIDVIIYENINK
jgi:hypothetical protein